jgi:DNA repair exonuclease SbcCD ATPase subunit
MKLLHLTVDNFFNYKHAEIDLVDRGLVLISGANGVGKSSLFVNAIPWALTGFTLQEKVFGATSVYFSKDDVINDVAGKNCMVRVRFEVGGQVYEVGRHRKHQVHGNHVWLTKNGTAAMEDISGETVKETDKKIADLIGMDFDTFTNSVIFGQGPVKRFMQCNDAEQRQILDSFMQLEVFTRARQLVTKDMVDVQAEMNKIEEDRLGQAATVSAVEAQLGEEIDEQKDLERELGEVEVTAKQATDLLRDKMTDKRKDIKESKAKHIRLTKKSDKLFKAMVEADDRTELEDTIKSLQTEIIRSEAERDNYNKQIAVSPSTTAFKEGVQCPECKQTMTKKGYLGWVASLKGKSDGLQAGLRMTETRIAFEQSELAPLEALMETDDKDRESYFEVRNEASLAKIAFALHESDLAKLEVEYETATAKQRYLKKSLAHQKERIERVKVELDKDQKLLDELCKSGARKLKAFDTLRFWSDGFSSKGIKDICFSRVLGFLNDRLEYLAGRLTGGEIHVSLDRAEDGKIKPVVQVMNKAKKYVMASEGQRKRADLCIALALQAMVELGTQQVNLSIFDEFDGSLDDEGQEMFVNFLQEEAARKGTVFVITHSNTLKSAFSNVIEVGFNDDGFSEVA